MFVRNSPLPTGRTEEPGPCGPSLLSDVKGGASLISQGPLYPRRYCNAPCNRFHLCRCSWWSRHRCHPLTDGRQLHVHELIRLRLGDLRSEILDFRSIPPWSVTFTRVSAPTAAALAAVGFAPGVSCRRRPSTATGAPGAHRTVIPATPRPSSSARPRSLIGAGTRHPCNQRTQPRRTA